MNEITKKMRNMARDILEKGEADLILGWEKGSFWYSSPPVFIDNIQDIDRLIWDDYCHHNLSKYLIDLRNKDQKTAIFLKGCDYRAFNRLLQDKQIKKEQVVLIGLPCPGLRDEKTAKNSSPEAEIPLADKCLQCKYPEPLVYDYFIGEPKAHPVKEADYKDVEAIEAMTPDQRYEFWTKEYDRCIRCYACRNICPACSCRECVFDQSKVGWIEKANNTSENLFFALTRAMHVAGRCIECGECQRACPQDIPIMLLNKKIIKDINELFGAYDAGIDPKGSLPLGHFDKNDPEEFL